MPARSHFKKEQALKEFLRDAEPKLVQSPTPELDLNLRLVSDSIIIHSLISSCYGRYLCDEDMGIPDFLLLCTKMVLADNKLVREQLVSRVEITAAPTMIIPDEMLESLLADYNKRKFSPE